MGAPSAWPIPCRVASPQSPAPFRQEWPWYATEPVANKASAAMHRSLDGITAIGVDEVQFH